MLGATPDRTLTLSSGLSRALMLERPTLRCALMPRYDKDDCEFISVDNVLRVSRYSPDFATNSLFRQPLEPQDVKTEKKPLGALGPARLAISRPGVTDRIHFRQLREPEGEQATPAGYVDIGLKAVSLNAKEVYAMSGRVETRQKTTGFDFSGVVTSVGSGANGSLKVGDRVVAYAPFHVGTTARIPAGCVHRLLDHEDFTVMPTLLLVYATALYVLNDRAHLQPGESVLIHAGSGSGGVGVAAITLALNMGAVVYTTCGSQAQRVYLVNELGMDPSHMSGVPLLREQGPRRQGRDFHGEPQGARARRAARSGAAVDVVRGDVSSAEDVKTAVAACVASGGKVGGVVQAAMGLHEALFTRMPNSAW
ncbi:uncharacterized protein PG986_011458 [Apiospora aurea]|uniref:Enoyl reductase (ER) domain-containing protein n=1 Tax=Apiospora aurea TaxID=335848 RepID=A0ABR1Q5C9_9PEZI